MAGAKILNRCISMSKWTAPISIRKSFRALMILSPRVHLFPLYKLITMAKSSLTRPKKVLKSSEQPPLIFKLSRSLKSNGLASPTFNNGLWTVQFKVTRGTNDPNWQLNLYDIGLFVYTTEYVGESYYDSRISNKLSGSAATNLLNKTGALSTLSTYPMLKDHTYYVRVGARLNYAFSFGAGYLYNYTEVKKVVVPTISKYFLRVAEINCPNFFLRR